MPKFRVLVAEDEEAARRSLAELLRGEGFSVLEASDGQQALSLLLQEEPEAALLDIRMPGMDGLEVLRRAQRGGSRTAFLVMTAYGDSNTAIEAMKLHAFDYLVKPIDFRQVRVQLQRALEQSRSPRPEVEKDAGSEAAMIGHSPAMQHVYKLIGQVAASDATVLVRGESGTGKELVVNAIHHNSSRARGPLVKVNCASIPETLLESELFGHEKGAFTNALYRRVGRFEEANGGTLFLDEIGELAPALQAKLLRVVQERSLQRLGSNANIALDLRLVTATARDLEEMVAEGQFREDLYYRLAVVSVPLPALRERKQDIPALVQHFLRRTGQGVAITPGALAILCEYHWPGNVRELENTVARALVLARGSSIDAGDVQLLSERQQAAKEGDWTAAMPLRQGWKANVEAVEKAMVERALAETQGNKSRAAELLGIHRRLLYEKLREFGVDG